MCVVRPVIDSCVWSGACLKGRVSGDYLGGVYFFVWGRVACFLGRRVGGGVGVVW
jgi:hypothetical protein